MELVSTQERQRIFEHYMRMDPTKAADRCFMENKCASLAHSMFLEAQQLELLRNRLEAGNGSVDNCKNRPE
jgi:hypothetical protein